MKYGEVEVAKAIPEYFRDWMCSKVGVREWWGKKRTKFEKQESEEEAWERMLNLDTSQITDPGTKEFTEVAYLWSHRHFEQKQAEDKISDMCSDGMGQCRRLERGDEEIQVKQGTETFRDNHRDGQEDESRESRKVIKINE